MINSTHKLDTWFAKLCCLSLCGWQFSRICLKSCDLNIKMKNTSDQTWMIWTKNLSISGIPESLDGSIKAFEEKTTFPKSWEFDIKNNLIACNIWKPNNFILDLFELSFWIRQKYRKTIDQVRVQQIFWEHLPPKTKNFCSFHTISLLFQAVFDWHDLNLFSAYNKLKLMEIFPKNEKKINTKKKRCQRYVAFKGLTQMFCSFISELIVDFELNKQLNKIWKNCKNKIQTKAKISQTRIIFQTSTQMFCSFNS